MLSEFCFCWDEVDCPYYGGFQPYSGDVRVEKFGCILINKELFVYLMYCDLSIYRVTISRKHGFLGAQTKKHFWRKQNVTKKG